MEVRLALSDKLGEHLVSVFTFVWPDPVFVPNPLGLETPLIAAVETPALMRTLDSDPSAEYCGHRRKNRNQNLPDPERARTVRHDHSDRNRRCR